MELAGLLLDSEPFPAYRLARGECRRVRGKRQSVWGTGVKRQPFPAREAARDSNAQRAALGSVAWLGYRLIRNVYDWEELLQNTGRANLRAGCYPS